MFVEFMGGRKILVLDIDETLLNIEPLFFLKRFKKNYKDYEGKLIFEKYYLSPRPRVKKFIKKAAKHFDLVAFSVVSRKITKEKLEVLGIGKDFIKIYGKEDLIDKKKSLKKIANDLNINISDITAIDDMPELFLEQDNIIKIRPWFIGDSKEDNGLIDLFEQLLKLDSTKIPS